MHDPEKFNADGTLAHFGVKGMKWGVRKAQARNADIKSARKRIRDSEDQASREANSARDRAVKRTGSKKAGREAALKVMSKWEDKVVGTPDDRMATSMTSGERFLASAALTGIAVAAIYRKA